MKIIKTGNPTGEPVSIIFECSKCGCVYEVEFEKAERLEHWRAGVSYNRSCPMCGKSNSRTRKAVEAEFGLFEWHKAKGDTVEWWWGGLGISWLIVAM